MPQLYGIYANIPGFVRLFLLNSLPVNHLNSYSTQEIGIVRVQYPAQENKSSFEGAHDN